MLPFGRQSNGPQRHGHPNPWNLLAGVWRWGPRATGGAGRWPEAHRAAWCPQGQNRDICAAQRAGDSTRAWQASAHWIHVFLQLSQKVKLYLGIILRALCVLLYSPKNSLRQVLLSSFYSWENIDAERLSYIQVLIVRNGWNWDLNQSIYRRFRVLGVESNIYLEK